MRYSSKKIYSFMLIYFDAIASIHIFSLILSLFVALSIYFVFSFDRQASFYLVETDANIISNTPIWANPDSEEIEEIELGNESEEKFTRRFDIYFDGDIIKYRRGFFLLSSDKEIKETDISHTVKEILLNAEMPNDQFMKNLFVEESFGTLDHNDWDIEPIDSIYTKNKITDKNDKINYSFVGGYDFEYRLGVGIYYWYSSVYRYLVSVQSEFLGAISFSPGLARLEDIRSTAMQMGFSGYSSYKNSQDAEYTICVRGNDYRIDGKNCDKEIYAKNEFNRPVVGFMTYDGASGGAFPVFTLFLTSIFSTVFLYIKYFSIKTFYFSKIIFGGILNFYFRRDNLQKMPITMLVFPSVVLLLLAILLLALAKGFLS